MRVSVEIVFYNNESTLADAIRSVFAQTFEDWELILVDDGSTDSSLALAESVQDPRVRIVANSDNRGVGARFNQIRDLARGVYVARMDGDDIMHPDRLARQVQFLDTNPQVDVVGTAMYTIDQHNRITGMRGDEPLGPMPEAGLTPGCFCHPTVMGRAEWFRRNPYNADYRRAQDHELWARTCTSSTFARLPEPLMFYRENHRNALDYLKTYLRSAGYSARVVREHGPAAVGSARTVCIIAELCAKCAIYGLATLSGLQPILMRKRNKPLAPEQMQKAEADLARALATLVPGLSDCGSSEERREESIR